VIILIFREDTIDINGVKVTLFPAGHTIGSSQILLEHRGKKWVVSGDYKVQDDGISGKFQPIKCDVFITEATFALPIYNWNAQSSIFKDIENWWRRNLENNTTSILTCYSFGKAQRLLHNLDTTISPIFAHGSIYNINEVLRNYGFKLPKIMKSLVKYKDKFSKSLILTPNSSTRTNWMRRFKNYSLASASGWMSIRGIRRRRNIDRGFVLSDHADWNNLNSAIKATEAKIVYVTHGYTKSLTRWLNENNIQAYELETLYETDQS
jgi:putative mRNA 3-end processing factor